MRPVLPLAECLPSPPLGQAGAILPEDTVGSPHGGNNSPVNKWAHAYIVNHGEGRGRPLWANRHVTPNLPAWGHRHGPSKPQLWPVDRPGFASWSKCPLSQLPTPLSLQLLCQRRGQRKLLILPVGMTSQVRPHARHGRLPRFPSDPSRSPQHPGGATVPGLESTGSRWCCYIQDRGCLGHRVCGSPRPEPDSLMKPLGPRMPQE